MKRVALVIALTGCNSIFGLDETVTYDARRNYLDAMVDAPAMCPPPSVVPQFERELHQAIYADQNCQAYQTSAVGIALSQCYDPSYRQQIYESRVGPITEIRLARGDLENDYVYSFALVPEGSEVYVSRYDTTLLAFGVWRYERDASGIWHRMEQVPFSTNTYTTLSPISRGPLRHIFVRPNNATDIHEWAQDGNGTWADVATYTAADFGTSYVVGIDLSADGLRLLLDLYDSTVGNYVMAYSYRESINDRFSTPTPAPSAPKAVEVFMTEDCDRAYVPGFGAVFYVRRLP